MKRLIFLCLPLMLIAGCGTPSNQAKQYTATANAFAAVVQEATVIQQLGGFNQEQTDNVGVIIYQGKTCLDRWYASLKDPNLPVYDGIDCVNSSMMELLTYANRGNIK
jgi:hypothetical protein